MNATSCMSSRHQSVGDPIELGACLGHPMDPGERWGRLVAIRHGEDNLHRSVVRMFLEGDGAFPTGELRTTSVVFLVPHRYR